MLDIIDKYKLFAARFNITANRSLFFSYVQNARHVKRGGVDIMKRRYVLYDRHVLINNYSQLGYGLSRL